MYPSPNNWTTYITIFAQPASLSNMIWWCTPELMLQWRNLLVNPVRKPIQQKGRCKNIPELILVKNLINAIFAKRVLPCQKHLGSILGKVSTNKFKGLKILLLISITRSVGSYQTYHMTVLLATYFLHLLENYDRSKISFESI